MFYSLPLQTSSLCPRSGSGDLEFVLDGGRCGTGWRREREMGRHSPPHDSSPRGGHGGRGRSRSPPGPGRGSGGPGGSKNQGPISLLVRNIPLRCRPEDIRGPFEKFGRVRDVYLPKDYYSGQPRGFAFVEFADSRDAAEAKYQMDHQMLLGREIAVVLAAETRKRPEDMRRRTGARGYSDHEGQGRRTSRYGRSHSHSRSQSRSRSPRHLGRARSRSYSPAPRRRDDYSASPKRNERRSAKSPRRSKECDVDKRRKSYTPDDKKDRDMDKRRRSYTPDHKTGHNERSTTPNGKGSLRRGRSPRTLSATPPGAGSRSRSPVETPPCSCPRQLMAQD